MQLCVSNFDKEHEFNLDYHSGLTYCPNNRRCFYDQLTTTITDRYKFPAEDVEDCEAKCQKYYLCNAFEFNAQKGECYLTKSLSSLSVTSKRKCFTFKYFIFAHIESVSSMFLSNSYSM